MYKIELKIDDPNNTNYLGDFVRNNNIKLVLFGEYHGFSKQNKILKSIIKNTNPDFFLYEMLEERKILSDKEAKRSFLDKPNSRDFSFISTYGQLKPIIKLARSFNLPVIGCDLKNMGCKDKDWRVKKFSNNEGKRLTKKRESQQVKIINKYTSKGLVFALLGNYHLRRNSLVLSRLKVGKTILIKPLFNWSKKINYSKISYSVKLMDLST